MQPPKSGAGGFGKKPGAAYGVAPKTTADGFLADSFLGATIPAEVSSALPLFEQTKPEDLDKLWGIVYYIYTGQPVPDEQLAFAGQENVVTLVTALLVILR